MRDERDMVINDGTLKEAVQYLVDGQELEAADVLRTCNMSDCDVVDSWMDGNRLLYGLLIELSCPRASFDILSNSSHPITMSIEKAIAAVLPSDYYLKSLRTRAVSTRQRAQFEMDESKLSNKELKDLTQNIESQKALMIAVATGGPRIQVKNSQYKKLRMEIKSELFKLKIDDPNPYSDLWTWYGKWSDGSLPSYQSRRSYITDLYQPLLSALELRLQKTLSAQPQEPTGWARVDRNVDKINEILAKAKNEEDYQSVGLLCREAIISLAQAVYDPEEHGTIDGVVPSETDAKRMLESYISKQLSGQSNEGQRKFAKTAYKLAVELQHRRTATFRDAALCVESTRAIINTIAIIAGHRDPD